MGTWPTNGTIPKVAEVGKSWQPGDMDAAQYQFCRPTGIVATDLDETIALNLGLKNAGGSSTLNGRAMFKQADRSIYGSTPVGDGSTYYAISNEPDRVSVALGSNALLVVRYFAIVKNNSGSSSAGAKLYLNGTSVKIPSSAGGAVVEPDPSVIAGSSETTMTSSSIGLDTRTGDAVVTTGMPLMGLSNPMKSEMVIFNLPSSIYTVEVRFKPNAGSTISRKESLLWAEVIGF